MCFNETTSLVHSIHAQIHGMQINWEIPGPQRYTISFTFELWNMSDIWCDVWMPLICFLLWRGTQESVCTDRGVHLVTCCYATSNASDADYRSWWSWRLSHRQAVQNCWMVDVLMGSRLVGTQDTLDGVGGGGCWMSVRSCQSFSCSSFVIVVFVGSLWLTACCTHAVRHCSVILRWLF